MSEYYANKEKRDMLSELSLKVFGTRSKWNYFVRKRGYTITAIEEQMNSLLRMIEKVRESEQRGTEERSGETADGITTDGSANGDNSST